jgi:hypothetical protein
MNNEFAPSCMTPRVLDRKPRMSLELRSLLPNPNSCPARARISKEGVRRWLCSRFAESSFCGIDVAKDSLDVVVLPGAAAFVGAQRRSWLGRTRQAVCGLSIAAVGLEATGGYERGAMRALRQPACRRARSTRSIWRKAIGSMGE